ncbi:factor-independent urate hydroxylase [Salininema proteolyticum]|uniref:Uricase n=1 Tax=Salininema proteolyticum TaxID=1607685 RepID=A0ABV8U4V3_9ACTN
MAIELGSNRYGKAETRVVRVVRDSERHEIVDLNVSVALAGDLDDTHLTGANDKVLPTDTQKNTVFAFARDGIESAEEFGARLGEHFTGSQESIDRATVTLQEYTWTRHGDHTFSRGDGGEHKQATVVYENGRPDVTVGLRDLLVLNSTDSEFTGYIVDEYTTLAPATDRILATAVTADWHFSETDVDWNKAYTAARTALIEAFRDTYSLSLQQTLYAMGAKVIEVLPQVDRVTLTLPNKHHFLVDLEPFELDNPGLVFFAADRPYGLIEGTVERR